MGKDKTILRQMSSELCTGCRACEVACSFHHTKAFNPECSSIEVKRNDSVGDILLTLYDSCDQCKDEEDPFCIRFCAPEALGTIILSE